MKILFVCLLIFWSLQSPAQILNRIKDRAAGKARSEVSNAKYNAKNKVREAGRKELDDFNAQFDSTDIDYAILLSDNSGVFGGRGKGEFGAKFIRLAGIANSLIKDADLTDEENARLNLQLGQSAYATGRYVYAEKRLTAAKNYFEKGYLTSDLGYLKTISGHGLLYTAMGRFAQAEKFTMDALQLRRDKMGEDNISVAASYNNYAVLHYNLGQYNESEKEFESALSIIAANNQKESMPYAIIVNNKAILYQSMGRYEEGAKLLEEALHLAGRLEVTKAKNHLKFFSNLALLYQQMGKYAEAERIYQGLEKRLEKGKPEYANMMNNLAILYLVMKKDDLVEDLLRRSAHIYKTAMGETSPAYAKVVSDLGNFLRYKGRYAEATPMLEGVLQNREQILGIDHPLYVQSEEDLAILWWKKKEYAKAYTLYRDVMEKSLTFINRYFPPMSEAEKAKYWDILSVRFQRFYNFSLEAAATNNTIIADLFEYRLATKGLLLSSVRKVSESILQSGNEQLVKNYLTWIDLKEQLTTLYAYSKEELKEQSVNLDSLQAAANAMEKKLSESSKEFSQFYFTSKISFAEIQRQLKPEEALVEIIRLRYYDQVLTDSCRYIGLVVTKEQPGPKLVLLTNGEAMEGKIAKAYRLSMKNKISDEKSYTHYWAPFEPELKGKKKIFVSPDGVYSQLSLYTLKQPGGDFLINKYDIVLLGNPKDVLARNNPADPSIKKATLIGFPEYSSASIPQLPATKTEVDGINKVLRSSGYQVAEFIQKDATEVNLKSTRKISILHIATHGYFLKDVEKASWPIGVHADNAKENVLLRSGLMLSGAAEADKESASLENKSNGVITSYEAMNLDLQGTHLVVLSACETGLGEVRAGEGVYGLQRAFLVAGAEALVMSLWKVDDAATQQLMNNFYTNWTKTGDKQKAFKQAQLQLMTKYKEPFYWGAFVMMED
ncbi:MAG: CHAT domain-containing protein [Chitinophagaceae bacterium]|nr:CHAT domain-containing protein [Chitinophagaceae bacterium]